MTINKNNKVEYKILDNGGYPFKVEVLSNCIKVYKLKKPDFEKYEETPILTFNEYIKLYVAKEKPKGNSLILHLKDDKYIFIGWNIYKITISDGIKEFHSEINNSDVPYPYIVGNEYTYFLLENEKINNAYIDEYSNEDRNEVYYHTNDFRKYFEKYDIEVLVERLWFD